MDSRTVFQLGFDFFTSKPIGLTYGFAEALTDRRDVERIGHSFLEMRRLVADPPHRIDGEDMPTETLAGQRRRAWHNRRREHDPLGEGHPCTWRTRLIKVAATVRESTRRVVVQLSSSWPYLKHYRRVSEQLLAADQTAFDTG